MPLSSEGASKRPVSPCPAVAHLADRRTIAAMNAVDRAVAVYAAACVGRFIAKGAPPRWIQTPDGSGQIREAA